MKLSDLRKQFTGVEPEPEAIAPRSGPLTFKAPPRYQAWLEAEDGTQLTDEIVTTFMVTMEERRVYGSEVSAKAVPLASWNAASYTAALESLGEMTFFCSTGGTAIRMCVVGEDGRQVKGLIPPQIMWVGQYVTIDHIRILVE